MKSQENEELSATLLAIQVDTAKVEADRAKVEADRAKVEADRAEAKIEADRNKLNSLTALINAAPEWMDENMKAQALTQCSDIFKGWLLVRPNNVL